ncbi:MAG: HAD-IA family hydrolase [Streptomyces sp.]|nr:HAD-IA family hydrolase [Streptomyces sp.]
MPAAGAAGAQNGRGAVRVALVGLGWAGRSIWLPRLQEHPGYRVTALVEPDPAARAAVPAGGPAVLADASGLDPAQVDLAVVAVPNHLHATVAAGLLRRGIPVFLEKPVCLDVTEADLLAAAEQEGGVVLLAGSAARYRADVQALRALAAGLGPIRHIDLAWVRASGVPDAGGWFTSRHLAGGGALLDLGWHLLDTVGPLLGTAPDFVHALGTVSADFVGSGARGAAWRGTRSDGRGGDVEDTARGFLVTDGGTSVSLRASWASHEAVDTTRITVEGSAGSATLTCTFGFSPNRRPAPLLTSTRDGTTTQVAVPAEPVGAEYTRQLDVLPGLLADPGLRGAAVAQARRTIGVIERLYASAARPAPALPHQRIRPAPTRRQHPFEAVVFDLDGVVVDSFAVMRQAFLTAYAEVVGDGKAPFEEYSKHLGRYFPDIMRIMGLPLELEGPFVRESYRLAHQVTVFDGVPELLADLTGRGLRLAVATGKSGPRARSLLDTLGLLPHFTHVIGSDEVARAKPAPDIVLRALDLLGVRPERAMMVGDAVTDLASARGAGVTAVAALWGETDEPALLAASPDAVLRRPGDLLALCPPAVQTAAR